MRQKLNKKKTDKLKKELNLPIVQVWVRGGTDHRKDLCLENGTIMHLDRNGELFKSDTSWK